MRKRRRQLKKNVTAANGIIPEQFNEITAYKCKSCGQVLITGGGLERHCKHCQHVDPQIEGQVSLDESSKQRQGDTLRRDRSEARGQECCGAVRLPGAKGRDHSRQGFR